MPRSPIPSAVVVALTVLLAACGGDDGGTADGTSAPATGGGTTSGSTVGSAPTSAAPTTLDEEDPDGSDEDDDDEELTPEQALADAAFIAVGVQSSETWVQVSSDGQLWTAVAQLDRSMGSPYLAVGPERILMFAPGQGRPGPLLASDDRGLTWEELPALEHNLVSIGVVDGAFHGMSQRVLYRSADGVTWEAVHDFGNYVGNVFEGDPGLAVFAQDPQGAGASWASADGRSWTEAPFASASGETLFGLGHASYAHDGSAWWALGSGGQVFTSADRTTWEPVSELGGNFGARGLAVADGTFVAVQDNGTAHVSADGTSWDRPEYAPSRFSDVEPLG